MSHEEIDAHMKSKRKTVSSYRVKICITIGMLAHCLAIGLVILVFCRHSFFDSDSCLYVCFFSTASKCASYFLCNE